MAHWGHAGTRRSPNWRPGLPQCARRSPGPLTVSKVPSQPRLPVPASGILMQIAGVIYHILAISRLVRSSVGVSGVIPRGGLQPDPALLFSV